MLGNASLQAMDFFLVKAITALPWSSRHHELWRFQNVADTLRALHADAATLQVAIAAEQNAGASLALIRRQLAHGYVDRLALIGAEQAQRQAALNVAQANASRLSDTAALFQALGGGWTTSPAQ